MKTMDKPIDKLIFLCDGNGESLFQGVAYMDSQACLNAIIDWAYTNPAEFYSCINVRGIKALGVKRMIWLVARLEGAQEGYAMNRIVADQILNALKKFN